MTACIGWATDAPCPVWGDFHGCKHPDTKHPPGTPHTCACGATTRTTLDRKEHATR